MSKAKDCCGSCKFIRDGSDYDRYTYCQVKEDKEDIEIIVCLDGHCEGYQPRNPVEEPHEKMWNRLRFIVNSTETDSKHIKKDIMLYNAMLDDIEDEFNGGE